MKILMILMTLAALSLQAQAKVKENVFGAKPAPISPVTLTSIIDQFEKYQGKNVVVAGTVEKVCEQKGCWLTLNDGNNSVRTLFKDYGFFVPKEILGKKVKLEGELTKKEISVAMARHFAKDEGLPESEVKKITKPKLTYEFVATGVEVQ